MPKLPQDRLRRPMTVLSGIRRRIQKLGPYQSLILILLPLLLVEPLKLVALVIAGKGHWLAGTGMIIGAYATSLLCVERLFRALKPKLLMMSWFAKGWTWFSALSWSRLSEQNLRLDKWSVCRG
jgi:hypothetical protein